MSRVFDASQLGVNATGITTPGSMVYDALSEYSFAAWIYPTAVSSFSAIFSQDAANNYTADFNIRTNGGGAAFLDSVVAYSVTNAESTSSTTLPLNAWTHVAATFSFSGDKKVHLYINGVEASYSFQTVASGTRVTDVIGGFSIGYDTFDGDGFTGRIAEFATWNEALTSGQVTTLAASTTGVASIQPANLVGYWHLCGTMSPEPDVSGNHNNGVLSTNPPTKGADSPGFNCPSPVILPWSSTDSRNFGNFPNASREVNQTKTYDVQVSDNPAVPGTDSRVSKPVASGTYPQNSRTPGLYGPGEN